ncbi:MAG: type VI secretion system baseplate subunit TssG [Pseudomonadota bacterium]|nr:type VI secretion system baseplate subunit TssG [Pseudomonadota bacterium]
MATEDRSSPPALIAALLDDPGGFTFYRALQILEAADPDSTPIGTRGAPAGEAIRLAPKLSLGFPTREVESIERLPARLDQRDRYRVTVNLPGLYGSNSPLPAFYTEQLLGEERGGGDVRREFLDFFHHRLLSLLYRAGGKYRYYLSYRRGATDAFSQRIFALMGLREADLRADAGLEWTRLLPYAGLLMARNRSVGGLEAVIAGYFQLDEVALEPCSFRKMRVAPEQQTRLGVAHVRLGADMTLGEEVPDRAGKFRLRFGPLTRERFERFLPSGPDYPVLRRLLSYLVHQPLERDLVLVLDDREAAAVELNEGQRLGLGWSTWLGQPPPGAREVVISL